MVNIKKIIRPPGKKNKKTLMVEGPGKKVRQDVHNSHMINIKMKFYIFKF